MHQNFWSFPTVCSVILQWEISLDTDKIKKKKKDCFFNLELPHLAHKGSHPLVQSNSPSCPSKAGQESQSWSLWGQLCPQRGGTQTVFEDHLHMTVINKATSGVAWCFCIQERGQESVIFFPPREVISDLVSMLHTFVSCISLSRQQLLQKIPLKRKGLLFTLARRPLLLENKRNLHLNPNDIAPGTLFTV